jgi:hypothetical protein
MKSQTVDEGLLETYLQMIYPIVNLTFDSAQQQQKQIQAELRQREQVIAALTSLLASDRTFERYITCYYNYYRPYSYKHAINWYYQPWVPEEDVLTDTAFWEYVLGDRTHVTWETKFPNTIIASLKEEAIANDALHRRDTPEKLIADEKTKLVAAGKQLFQEIWEGIAKIYEIKCKYATHHAIQAIYLKEYQACIATPIENKPEPLYLHVVAKHGFVSEKARVKDFVTQSLPLGSVSKVAAWLPDSYYYLDYLRYGASRDEAFRARFTVQEIWSKITRGAQEIQKIRCLLPDEAAILKAYYTSIGHTSEGRAVWEQLNNEHVDNNIWEALRKEARRNAILSRHMNTFEKTVEMRKNELYKKIVLLTQELDAYKATLPQKHAHIRKEMDAVEERRAAFRAYVHEIIQILIHNPDVLGEQRILKESDIREHLLNLPPRQAYVRVGDGIDRRPQKCIVRTPDLPQAVKKDEAKRRQRLIQGQTRAKYGRPQSEVEQELRDAPVDTPNGGEEQRDDEPPDSWYEE